MSVQIKYRWAVYDGHLLVVAGKWIKCQHCAENDLDDVNDSDYYKDRLKEIYADENLESKDFWIKIENNLGYVMNEVLECIHFDLDVTDGCEWYID